VAGLHRGPISIWGIMVACEKACGMTSTSFGQFRLKTDAFSVKKWRRNYRISRIEPGGKSRKYSYHFTAD
jgi:hypothetical protein